MNFIHSNMRITQFLKSDACQKYYERRQCMNFLEVKTSMQRVLAAILTHIADIVIKNTPNRIEKLKVLPDHINTYAEVMDPAVRKYHEFVWEDNADFVVRKYASASTRSLESVWMVQTPLWVLVFCTDDSNFKPGRVSIDQYAPAPDETRLTMWNTSPFVRRQLATGADFQIIGDRDAFDQDAIIMFLSQDR